MTWQDQCRAMGGTPTVFPPQFGSKQGQPACRFGGGAAPLRYEEANLSIGEQLTAWWTKKDEQVAITLGNAVEARDDALAAVGEATGLNHGLAGVTGKLLGVPHWVVLAGALYVGYRILERETR